MFLRPVGVSQYSKYSRCVSSIAIGKVLIANRGEIACRVARTAKRLGIKVVAVFSDADKNAMHVSVADEAYHIGPAASSESYLRGDKILDVAHRSGCHGIHPGYGFLSENAEFADKCSQAGIAFIGPPASAIRDMGCKSTSKKIMEAAGVAVVNGYHGEDQSDMKLKSEAQKIGYPIMLKALKGGGGKGMRVVEHDGEFDEQLASARNEASKAFGDTAMLVEKFVDHPRHVEVQVFGDMHGNYVHLHERDCSVQRRHQKIIEEAPAPGLNNDVRQALGAAAVRAAKAVGYVGAGTVEFILDAKTHKHYFMEMNTRLQVEHPVTEMITGTDLVEWQFRVASGEPLPQPQENILVNGHAFEARIYAEDPENGFLPQAGSLYHLDVPVDARVDTGVRAGDPVPVFYDPLIAKLIVWGSDRAQALKKLNSSLASFQVEGVPTNINFLLALALHKEFQAGNVHTNFIPNFGTELLKKHDLDRRVVATVVAAKLASEPSLNQSNVFETNSGFRINHNLSRKLHLLWNGEPLEIHIEYLVNGSFDISFLNETFNLKAEWVRKENGAFAVKTSIDGEIHKDTATVTQDAISVYSEHGVSRLDIPEPKWKQVLEQDAAGTGDAGQLAISPMPGVVDQVFVSLESAVSKGQALITVIAMKMEYTIRAPKDGVIGEILHKPGDAVAKGTVLVRYKE